MTKKRLFIETMEQVLSNTNKVMVGENSGNSLMYLPIDKIIEQNNASRSQSTSSSSQVLSREVPSVTPSQTTNRSIIREGR